MTDAVQSQEQFKASITTWTRIEPNPTSENMEPSLEACIYDPAWMLARQWQVGEFKGEDAGTPIDVSLKFYATPLTLFKPNNQNAVKISGIPIEFLAGNEPKSKFSHIEAAEAGMELVNLLLENNVESQTIKNITCEFPFKLDKDLIVDTAGANFLELLSNVAERDIGLPNPYFKGHNNKTLEEILRSTAKNQKPDPALQIPDKEASGFVDAAKGWVNFVDYPRSNDLLLPKADSWDDDHMEYSFKVEARNTEGDFVVLKADEWNGSKLDWYSLDVDTQGNMLTKEPVEIPKLHGLKNYIAEFKGLPTSLIYKGMPSARWWEFEDARVNFAQIDCSKTDLARMLLVEFACSYGNDWYLIPMTLPVGAIYTNKTFKVRDTFGEEWDINPIDHELKDASNEEWCIFRQSYKNNSKHSYQGLLLYPTSYLSQSSILEQVQYFRDETANVAWALETQVESADGRCFNRQRNYVPKSNNSNTFDSYAKEQYEYKLVSEIPDYWYPLVPIAPSPKEEISLNKYQLIMLNPNTKPLGEFLNHQSEIWQEEIPSEGSELTSRYFLSRASDGKVLLWRSKQKKTGRGEGTSGLQYDRVE